MRGTFYGFKWLGWLVILSVFTSTGFSALRLTVSTNDPVNVSNNTATVYLPASDYYSMLQVSTNLAANATWTDIASPSRILFGINPDSKTVTYGYSLPQVTNNNGTELAFTLARDNQPRFFRLRTTNTLFNLCSFALFYHGTLELSTCANLIFNGPVYASGPIYLGTSNGLTFSNTVTTSSVIDSPARNGLGPWTTTNWGVTFSGQLASATNVPSLLDTPLAYLGTTNLHTFIEPPNGIPIQSNYTHYYQVANMILLVTNSLTSTNPQVQLTVQTSYNGNLPGYDPSPLVQLWTNVSAASLSTNLPFLTLTNQFYDQREYKTNLVTDIDIGILGKWFQTNYFITNKLAMGFIPQNVYIADQRTGTTHNMPVVRLKNAAQLPEQSSSYVNGFTFGTVNPLYIWGNYNTRTSQGTNSVTATSNTIPAAVISDALTILSENWHDSESYTAYNPIFSLQSARDTVINTAIITGSVPSTGTSDTTFSGGAQNLPRLLENWAGYNLWLNGSLARLWDSQTATNQFRNPYGFFPATVNPYYNSPSRHFNFDTNFLNPMRIPPGVPVIQLN